MQEINIFHGAIQRVAQAMFSLNHQARAVHHSIDLFANTHCPIANC